MVRERAGVRRDPAHGLPGHGGGAALAAPAAVRLYAPLLAAFALAWAVPPDALLGLRFVPRFVAAVALGFAPVFLANLVFAERFRDVGSSTVAFGTNLLGAIVGGVLEYGALVVGTGRC